MDKIRKYKWFIACGVLAVVGFAIRFYPVDGMADDLKKKAQSDNTELKQINTVLVTPRKTPDPDPEKSDSGDLKEFPSRAVIDWGTEITKKVQKIAGGILETAIALNNSPEHKLVHSELNSVSFVKGYDGEVRPIVVAALKPGTLPDPASAGRLILELKAGIPPTAAEIDKARLEANPPPPVPAGGPGTGGAGAAERPVGGVPLIAPQPPPNVSREDAEKAMKEATAKVDQAINALRMKRANEISLYVPPDGGLYYHPSVREALNSTVDQRVNNYQAWIAQLGLWIQQDLVQAIVKVNKDANGQTLMVPNAVVKRLFNVTVQDGFMTATGPRSIVAAIGAPPPPADATAVAPPSKYAFTPTGRVSNNLYDVMQFTVQLDVDGTRLPKFLDELSRNRFITVLSIDSMATTDKAALALQGYYFGDGPVVNVQITCEALFFRGWTTKLMPKVVKDYLQIPDTGVGSGHGQ